MSTVDAPLAPPSLLIPSLSAVIARDMAYWKGRTVSVSAMRAVALKGPNVGLFRVEANGSVSHVAGLATNWHFDCLMRRLMPRAASAAVRLAPPGSFPTWFLVHGWDEPVVRLNESGCNKDFGHLHANMWNYALAPADVAELPFLSHGKIRGCHADILVPHEGLCDTGFVIGTAVPVPVPWELRKPVAIWRGWTSGGGTFPRRHLAAAEKALLTTNHRFRLVSYLRQWPDLFDVGLVDFSSPYNVTSDRVKMTNWSSNKYVADFGGSSYSNRDGVLALLNATIIEACPFVSILFDSMVDKVHYVRGKFDGSDLRDIVLWLREHDAEAKKMGEELFRHYTQNFDTDGLVNYMTELLIKYSQTIKFVPAAGD